VPEDFLQCPLKTDYATSDKYNTVERPFSALSGEVLAKLFAIRQWPIDAISNPIPFKMPTCVRESIFDTYHRQPTDRKLEVKEFQKQAIHHLIRMPRFILGDAVGLGKTLDAIIAFAWLKERNPKAKMVVITTKSTTYQWADEVERYTTLRAKVMTDTYKGMKSSNARYAQMIDFFESDDADILVAKYDSLKGKRKLVDNPDTGQREKERVSEEVLFFTKIFKQHRENIVLTLDECHRFKSTGSQTRQLIMNICKFPERVWALTATAIKNGLEEFYSICCAIGVKPLGTMTDFRSEYCLWREMYIGRGMTKRIITGYKNVAFFKEQIRPFFLGRSQKQVKETLPRLTTVYHPIDLDEKQADILKKVPLGLIELPPIVYKVAGEIFTKDRDASNEMTQLSVQQLVVDHWALLDRNNEEVFLTTKLSPKEELLLDMLDGEYAGEKMVVYTKYRSWIDRLEWLTENGHFTERKFLRITGNENEAKRNENKQKFQAPDSGYDLIVINAAGMEGINLQQAAHMIMLDTPWSWGDLIQLVGRMVRMASPHSACTLHLMPAKGTIDEYTIETLKTKKGVFEAILGTSHSAGILDGGTEVDLQSGMEDVAGSEEEFKALLRAYAKSVGMKDYLSGDQIKKAQNEEYKMVFEREKKTRKKKDSKPKEQDLKWFLD
jgi:SNF2 family DNA or RNA helicase